MTAVALAPERARPAIELVPAAVPRRLPASRDAISRRRLVEPLCRLDVPPLVALVAPAGYGKTTLLDEWAERDPRPFGWLSLTDAHNDPARLEADLRQVTRVCERAADGRFVLVLDDLHALHRLAALRAIAALAGGLPAEATLAVASRAEPALPIARLRAQRLVAELRAKELAMTRTEAAALLQRAGAHLDRAAIDLLVSRTEGWPAGLTLAALSLADQSNGGGAVARFGGEDRLVADYLRDEVLATLAPDAREFLLRTSVLEILTGPMCDAVLERRGSAAVLGELARSNVLVVPMDRTDEHFRYHRLLAQMLRAELRRAEPGLEPELHRRASEWCRRTGDVDRGVRHALCAGDVRGAGELVRSGAAAAVAQGRSGLAEHWLGHFTSEQIATQPTLAVAAAACALVRGEGDLAEHWGEVAAAGAAAAGEELEVAVAALRAALCRDGIARMRTDATHAYALGAGDSPWRALACLLFGTANALAGEAAAAVRRLEEGAHRAAVTAPHLHALCLTQLAVLDIADEDWESAAALVARARSQVDRYSLAADATSALVFAASAVVRARRGRIEDARADLAEAARLRDALTDFAPWYEAELGVLMARAAIRLGDVAGARDLLSRATRHVARAGDPPVLAEWLEDARRQCDASGGGASAELSSLTAAELRILGYLPTHLSFREIAERTYVSANTVKTQANAVYRKLGVSCRSEAVARAREIGLLDS
ncbi:MAG TPA: LuxR C-terminal-related transcriptional regulator [Solirubrobacteraceae bacterium]